MSDDGFFGNMPYLATMPSCELYIKAIGVPNNATFYDWSPAKQTITPSNTPVESSTESHYGSTSIYLNGTNQYLTVASINFAATNWICHAVVYPTSITNCQLLSQQSATTGNMSIGWSISAAPGYPFFTAMNDWIISSSTAISANAWTDLIWSKIGGNYYIYMNGIQTMSTTKSDTIGAATSTRLGGSKNGTNYCPGYFDEFAFWSSDGGVIPTHSQIYSSSYPFPRRLIVG